jgi:hypothetical protein
MQENRTEKAPIFSLIKGQKNKLWHENWHWFVRAKSMKSSRNNHTHLLTLTFTRQFDACLAACVNQSLGLGPNHLKIEDMASEEELSIKLK